MSNQMSPLRRVLAAAALVPVFAFAGPAPAASMMDAPSLADAQQAINDENFAGAETMLRELTAEQPNNAAAWFLLGYALHAEGKIEEALVAHEKAASFEGTPFRGTALYNKGCALALLGQRDKAFEALSAAVAAGVTDADQFKKDPDLRNLRRDERWKKLLYPLEHPGGVAAALHFWVGQWDCYDASGNLNGHNTLEFRVDKKVVHESWSPEGGGSVGESWNWFDPAKDAWHQVWVDASGLSTQFVGTVKDEGVMFEGTQIAPDGTTSLVRMFVRPIENGRVQQTGTQSADEGKTWQPRYDLTYVPKGQAYSKADDGG